MIYTSTTTEGWPLLRLCCLVSRLPKLTTPGYPRPSMKEKRVLAYIAKLLAPAVPFVMSPPLPGIITSSLHEE